MRWRAGENDHRDGVVGLSDEGCEFGSVLRAGPLGFRVAVPFPDVAEPRIGFGVKVVAQGLLGRCLPACVVVHSWLPIWNDDEVVYHGDTETCFPPSDQDPADLMRRCLDGSAFGQVDCMLGEPDHRLLALTGSHERSPMMWVDDR